MKYYIATCLFIGQCLWAAQAAPADNGAQPLDDIALVINGEGITRRQLAQESAAIRAQLPPELAHGGESVDKQVLEQVINQHLLEQLQHKMGITATPQEVDRMLAFVANNNHVSVPELLTRVRRDTGMDEATYRATLAQTAALEKVKQALVAQNPAPIDPKNIDAQVAQVQKHQQVEVHLQDLLLPTPAGTAQQRGDILRQQLAQVSQALSASHGDLAQVADKVRGARFSDLGNVNMAQLPAAFANAVSGLSGGQVVAVPVADKDGLHFLKVVSKHIGAQSTIVPEADVMQIVLKAQGEQALLAQKPVIDNIYRQLLAGADFAALAKRYSQDGVSAVQGGKMGWVSAAQVPPTFAQVMLNLPLHHVSEPFVSDDGWHIIEVNARRDVDRSADILRTQVGNQLYAQYYEQAWQKALQNLHQQAYIDYRK